MIPTIDASPHSRSASSSSRSASPVSRTANSFARATAPDVPVIDDAASLRQWLQRRLRRALIVMTVLCTVIALFLGTFFGGTHLRGHFIYSFAIGFSCWICTDGFRLLLAAVVQRRRLRAGLPLSATGVFTGWRLMVPMVVLGTSVGLMLGTTIGDALIGGRSSSLLDWRSTSTRITVAVTIVSALFTLFAMTTLERLAVARVSAEAARAAASQLELKLLQSQLEPHMLFNTLANLRVLIGLDADRAQAMLDHLIGFLRSTLAASRVDSHPLAAEFARTADYLALMGYRMGARLATTLDLPAELRELPVPPLILQPLVENAIRHGIEPQVGPGRIEVAARRDGAQLVLTVRDTGVGLSAPGPAATADANASRFGLVQVRQRLATLHGGAAHLTLAPATGGGTLATIELPWPAP